MFASAISAAAVYCASLGCAESVRTYVNRNGDAVPVAPVGAIVVGAGSKVVEEDGLGDPGEVENTGNTGNMDGTVLGVLIMTGGMVGAGVVLGGITGVTKGTLIGTGATSTGAVVMTLGETVGVAVICDGIVGVVVVVAGSVGVAVPKNGTVDGTVGVTVGNVVVVGAIVGAQLFLFPFPFPFPIRLLFDFDIRPILDDTQSSSSDMSFMPLLLDDSDGDGIFDTVGANFDFEDPFPPIILLLDNPLKNSVVNVVVHVSSRYSLVIVSS